jgi:hypothetical protein
MNFVRKLKIPGNKKRREVTKSVRVTSGCFGG